MQDRVEASCWMQNVLPYPTMLGMQVHTLLAMYTDISLKVLAFLFLER